MSLNFSDKLVLLLTAALVLSSFGPYILDFGGGFVVEIAFFLVAALLLVYRPSILKQVVDLLMARPAILVTMFLSGCLLLGVYVHGDVFSAYSDFRASSVFFLSFFFFYSRRTLHHSLPVLYSLAFLASVLSITFFFVKPEDVVPTTIGPYRGAAELVQVGFPAIATALLMYISSIRHQPVSLLVASVLGGLMAVFSFYRSIWIVVILGVTFYSSLLLGSLIARRRFANLLFVGASVIGVAALVFYLSGLIIGFLSSDELHYGLSIEKFRDLFQALVYGAPLNTYDQTRHSYYIFMLDYWPRLLLPHGLGFDNFVGDIDPFLQKTPILANTIDSGYLFASFHFGLVFSIPFLVFVLYALSRRIRYSSSTLDLLYVLSSLSIVAFYFSVTGEMFTIIERAFFTGSFLGIVLNWRPIQAKPLAVRHFRKERGRHGLLQQRVAAGDRNEEVVEN
jgi:hypothetical protein